MELIALRPFRYGNRHLRAGESFVAPDGLASFYITVGRAKKAVALAPSAMAAPRIAARLVTADLEAEEQGPKPKRRRRTYKRRDLRAED